MFWSDSSTLDEGWRLKLASLSNPNMFFVSVSQTSVEGRRKVGAKQWPLEKVTKIETWMGNWRLPLETRPMQIFIPGPPSTLCHNRPLWEIRLVHYPKVISWLSFFLSISHILFPASIPVGVATCTLSGGKWEASSSFNKVRERH